MVARHTVMVKPLACLYAMYGGISAEHKDFWKGVTVEHLMQVYLASNATAYNVLKVIKEPQVLEPLQEITAIFSMLATCVMLRYVIFSGLLLVAQHLW